MNIKLRMNAFILILIFQSILPNRVSAQERDKDIQTVLGRERANPYTIENISKAYKELNPESKIEELPITDRYVKFTPKTYENLALLDKADIPLFDFPISHEIEKLGDYYIAPEKTEEDIPDYYALVDPWFEFPEVPYEIIADMHISIYDSKLTQLAFEMVGEEYEGEPREDTDGINLSKMCRDDDPNWPDCQCDIYLDVGDLDGYRDCLTLINTPPPPPPPPAESVCGCPVYNDGQRKPGGSVRVEDTQLGWQGVNNIRIVVLGAFWQLGTTKTDAKGCWRINKKFALSPIAVYAQFRSARITVRAMKGLRRIWQYGMAVQTHRFQSGPNYRNICMEFLKNDSDDTKEKIVWHAAHANNTIYDFDIYAQQDNIEAPPNGMQVFLSSVDEDASAPMLHQMQKNPGVHLATGGLVLGSYTAASIASIIGTWIPVLNVSPTPSPTVTALFTSYFIAFAPDVFFGYGANAIPSDITNEVFFHEYGHAANYRGLSNKDYYWSKEISYIIDNGGYGDGTATGAERAAIIESWGEFIGKVYADRKYALNHSLKHPTNVTTTESRRFIYRLEGSIPNNPLEGDGWIPWGLLTDLTDDGTAQMFSGTNFINDPVMEIIQNYSTADCFEAITSGNPTTLNDVEQNMINSLPIGQNATNVSTLFQTYQF